MNPDTPDDAEYLNSRMLPFVALATMVTLFGALGWLVDGGVGRYRALVLIGCCRIGGLVVSNEVILWDLIAGVATCEYSRRKFVALKKSSLVRLAQRNAARFLSGLLSTLESVGTVQSLNRATVPGSGFHICEMLRLRYITEKSEAASPFRSRIGQSACS
jgi:hypothetical protein